ncbi:DNA repair nucleotidyltransferase, partial [Cellulomonas bogoriensis 69B4 = DSM 16987]
MSVPPRTAAVWVPDWPVVAAMSAQEVPAHRPTVVHDGRRVTAVSAGARAHGVRRGMRRRHAQEVCPDLVLLGLDPGRDVRAFEPVAEAVESVVPGVEVARPGLLLLPAGGAARYHGSEPALAGRLVDAVGERTGHEAQVGVADGPGAAVLAARGGMLVPPGEVVGFLAPLGVTELVHVATGPVVRQVHELVDLLARLGVRTLGDLAHLPRADVHARLGAVGVWAHQVASGQDGRPAAVRRLEPDLVVHGDLDPPVGRVEAAAFAARRLAEELHTTLVDRGLGCGRLRVTARTEHGEELVRVWRTDTALGGSSAAHVTDRVRWQLEGWLTHRTGPEPGALTWLELRAEDVLDLTTEQGRLWGETNGTDRRAHRALLRVQGLLGAESVLGAQVQGGRDVRDQVHLVPWGEDLP